MDRLDYQIKLNDVTKNWPKIIVKYKMGCCVAQLFLRQG
jgi:hypothetical protein